MRGSDLVVSLHRHMAVGLGVTALRPMMKMHASW